jgi:RNA polymerase sigma factor (sigma-70 family)
MAVYGEGRLKKTVDHWMHFATWETRKDAMQEVYLWLCTYDLEKLQDAYSKGLLNALITRVIRNWWCTTKSVFTYKYRKYVPIPEEEFHLPPEQPAEPEDNDRMWLIKEVLKNLPDDEKKVWDSYFQTEEYKETAEQLDMNPWQVKYMVDRIRAKVLKALKWNGLE